MNHSRYILIKISPLLLCVYCADVERSEILPFIVVRRTEGRCWDISVLEKTIDSIVTWESKTRPSERDHLSSDEGSSSGSGGTGNKTNKRQQEPEDETEEEEPQLVTRSRKLLSKTVTMPAGYKGFRGGGSARNVVIAAGEISEIASWFRDNDLAEEKELSKLLNTQGKDVGSATMSSGIYCLLPKTGNTLYAVVRLRWQDNPEVHLELLRISLELSPIWLLFYGKDGIEENGFCSEAYGDPEMPTGHYFQKLELTKPSQAVQLLGQLRTVFRRYNPVANNLVRSASVLHIEYVFDVSLEFFSSTMVYHSLGHSGSEAKCKVATRKEFEVTAGPAFRNHEVSKQEKGLPDLYIGVSLRRRLRHENVIGYTVDLKLWLQMSSGYTPVMMLSCKPSDNNAVSSVAFPNVCFGLGQRNPGGADQSSSSRSHHQADKPASEIVREAMEKVQLPGPLQHILTTWEGSVQVIVCTSARPAESLEFLNKLTGSALTLHSAESVPDEWHACPTQTASGGDENDRQNHLWICCRPSNAMLYVLLSFDNLLLFSGADGPGRHDSAVLLTATALANVVVVLTSGFDESMDVLDEALLNSLAMFGDIPQRAERDEALFNNVLIPVVPPTELHHSCSDSSEDQPCCTKHFERICRQRTWASTQTLEKLQHFFGGVQPVCSKYATRTVQNIVREALFCYKDAGAFRNMLRMVLAALVTQKLEGEPGNRLAELRLEHIREKPWLDFTNNLLEALKVGRVNEGGKKVSVAKETSPDSVDVPGKDKLELSSYEMLGLLCGEAGEKKERTSGSRPRFLPDQRTTVQDMIKTIGQRADGLLGYKAMSPADLFGLMEKVFKNLTTHRSNACQTWLTDNIRHQPFYNPKAMQQCEKLVVSLRRQWEFCGERCEQASDKGRCYYRCLLPVDHSEMHNCLDPDEDRPHLCHHECHYCNLETRPSPNPCTQPAGHLLETHAANRGKNGEPHSCDEKHRGEGTCA